MAVNIEHEDASFGQIEGLKYAADNLIAAGQPGRRSQLKARAKPLERSVAVARRPGLEADDAGVAGVVRGPRRRRGS